MGKIVLDKVLGKNLQDFADNIDKNFSRIEGNGVWRGEKGESYAEQTIGLWKEDTDGSIVILNEPILETLFTESDGGSTAWPIVKAWAADKRDQFLALQIPKAWSLYPGFPLYYSQPAECFKLFKSDAYDTGADWSGMVAAVGSDDGSYTYKRYDILPRIYLDRVTGNYCWMINGVKTGITASINPDQETRNIRLYLIRTDAAGDTKYLVSKESGTAWTDKPDTLPRIGDFAWRLETKSITTGGVEKPAQVLEVCIYSGDGWVAATADDNNENFFLTYDDMVMHYVWDSIYGGLGDVYDADMRAIGTKSFQFPTHRDNGTATADTHKITSKSYADGTRSDLFVENPYKGQATGSLPDVKSNIVLSGYDDVYLGTPTMNLEGGVSYADERLVKKSEFDAAREDINKRLADLESHVIRTITIDELWMLDETDTNDGDLYKIDRCYWAKDTSMNPNVIYSSWIEEGPGNQPEYSILPYVRYVYLRVRHDPYHDTICWDHKGVGLVYMVHNGHVGSMLVDVEFDFPVSGYNDEWTSKWENTGYLINAYMGKHKSTSALDVNDTYNYGSYTNYLNITDFEEIGDGIDYKKFGVITWMRDPIYRNECAWDFMMRKTFELVLYAEDASDIVIPYFDPADRTFNNSIGGARLRIYGNKLNAYTFKNVQGDKSGISIPRGDINLGNNTYGDDNTLSVDSACIRIYYDDKSRSNPNYYPARPLIINNIFDSCNYINIRHMIGGGINDTAFDNIGIIDNIIKASSIKLYSSVFAYNNINNSTVDIGRYLNGVRLIKLSNMVRCTVNNSRLYVCLAMQDKEVDQQGGGHFISRGKDNNVDKILNVEEIIHNLWIYDCTFNHVRTLNDIFVLRGIKGIFDDFTYISNVIYNGALYYIYNGDITGVPCYENSSTSTIKFKANFIGIDVSEEYDNHITPYENTSGKGTNPPVKSMHIVKACSDDDILHDYYVMTGNNLPQLISNTIYDYTNVPYNKIVYVKRGGDLSTENYVHIPIRHGYDNIIYINIPIVGYGYTKSIEEILKN